MNEILVSICIPVFNGEEYLEQTINAILRQTYREYELLIVDNASTDKTEFIANSFSDPRIRYIRNDKNYGMVGNWNICLDEAKGEFIHLVCADDILESICIEKQLEQIKQNDNIAMVFNPTNVIDGNNQIIMRRRPFVGDQVFDGLEIAKKSFRSRNFFGEPSNILFRKSFSDKIGYFTEGMCYSPDWEYWLRLSAEGDVAYTDKFLMNFRVASTSTTSGLMKKKESLKADEALLISNIKKIKKLKISKFDIFIHKISMKFRFWAKVVFFSIKK